MLEGLFPDHRQRLEDRGEARGVVRAENGRPVGADHAVLPQNGPFPLAGADRVHVGGKEQRLPLARARQDAEKISRRVFRYLKAEGYKLFPQIGPNLRFTAGFGVKAHQGLKFV